MFKQNLAIKNKSVWLLPVLDGPFEVGVIFFGLSCENNKEKLN